MLLLATLLCYLMYILSMILFVREKSYGEIMLCGIGIIGTSITYIIYKKYNKIFSDTLYFVIIGFIILSLLVGSCYGFYGINHYDDALHLCSGAISCSIGVCMIKVFNSPNQIRTMNSGFIVLFLIMFSVGIAGFWEIIEFLIDLFLGLHAQAGGLEDTMIDMIDALVGCGFMLPFIMKKI